MNHPILWLIRAEAAPERHTLSSCLSLPADGPEALAEVAALLYPVRRIGRTVAVALVPRALTSALSIDGVRVPAGLSPLHHGSRIDGGNFRVWVAAQTVPETRTFTSDGARDAYCARTKVRLEPGATVVTCPGRPDRECGLVYTEAAWAADLPCHGCGRSSTEPEWRPPFARTRPDRERLLNQARRRAASAGGTS